MNINVLKRFPCAVYGLLLMYIFSSAVIAQEDNTRQSPKELPQLSLKNCIELAQEASPNALIVRKGFEQKTWDYRAWEAKFYPQVTLNANAPGLNRSINTFEGPEGTQLRETSQLASSVSLSLSQVIPFTGGEVSVSSGLLNQYELTGNKNSTWSSSPLDIQLSQPLFRFNALKWEQEIEPMRLKAARKEFVEDMENISVEATNKFFELYIAEMNYETARFNVQVNDTIFQLSKGRFQVGKIAENDLLQSELALMNSEIRVSEAELSYELAKQNLNIALGFDRLREIGIVIPAMPQQLSIDPDFAIEQARRNRSDILNLEIRGKEAEQSVERAKSSNGVTATIRASAGLNQAGDEFNEVYRNLTDRETFSVNLSMPLLQWGQGSAAIESAIAGRESARTSIALQENDFEQQVYVQVQNFLQAQKRIVISAKSDTIAQRRFEVAKNRFLIGKIDITDLYNAQNEKDSARQNYIQALRTYWVAYYRLRQLTLYDFIDRKSLVAD